ncbi:MAG TPA: chromosome segregation protein SMC [Acidimicrobiales bacterium]|jgi:chromosome segregation protein|nr:chromosome segregation protein SMC [Acidimicrobiales bacterium]
MFLKSLTLKGFKSFADTTVLEMEPGVTVVVGPNGSGKSNVVDAIGWVLGAQAPSAVRSQKMDDVIFAGTSKRAALGRAEVSLTIDNGAGLLPIDFSEVTITRTLFRNGDSEYALNGVPCRLLDIQELLSDTGVGRQQHVIVSQGQIDAVLNARPEDRRLIIEEAAGVLKFRRRKEKAERRLAATEGNLTRVQDLLREVRRQLRPLERQADAARRHGDLVAELMGVRVHLAGRELSSLRARLTTTMARKAELAADESGLKASLAQLDTAVLSTEAQLSAMGGHDVSDALVRFESLRERARGLAAVLAERRRNLERERNASVDQAVIATLEAEAARLAEELANVEADAVALAPDVDALARSEADLATERTSFESQWAEGVTPPSSRAAETRGELGALRSGVQRGAGEINRIRQRLEVLEQKAARLHDESSRLRGELALGEEEEAGLAAAFADAEATHLVSVDRALTAEEVRRSADAERHTWVARADALAQALDEAHTRAGAARLSEVAGVVGTLLDLVRIDDGYESAFEAAAGEALAAVVVDDIDAGRRALEVLHAGDLAGAVLPLGALRWPPPLPLGSGEPLRWHVRSNRDDVDALLDALFGAVIVVDGDWTAAVDLALANPASLIVTRDGDRFGLTGWRVGGPGSGATGAALAEARERAEAAMVAAAAADRALVDAQAAVADARRAELESQRALDEHDSSANAAADALARVEAERRDGDTEIGSLHAHLGDLDARVGAEQARIAELEQLLPGLESDEASALERGREMSAVRSRLEERAAAVAALRTDIEVRAAALDERRRFLRRRFDEVEERLTRNVAERARAEQRRVEIERTQLAVERLSALVADRLAIVEAELATLHEQRRRQSEEARAVAVRLDELRKQRSADERRLEEVREHRRRAEIEEAELGLRVETAVETIRRDLECEPETAMAAECPPLGEGVAPQARVRELERELRLMGPINPLALQEFEALRERHEFLEAQLDDVKSTRRELAKIIKAIDEEIVNVFAAAYADVSQNFEALFDTLFPGGRGRLRLTDPDSLLDTGIEIEAKPSGKNVRKLSLLSGGERSLTALAFLFAVFRSRPSPFYVMDEVEAALDDVNLHRFLDLVHEFREEAQLIIVSHQKRTMEAADCLYGVTMQSGGSSRVISEKVAV